VLAQRVTVRQELAGEGAASLLASGGASPGTAADCATAEPGELLYDAAQDVMLACLSGGLSQVVAAPSSEVPVDQPGDVVASCSALHADAPSGVYRTVIEASPGSQYINAEPQDVYCDNDSDGGGWMLVMAALHDDGDPRARAASR